MALQRVQAGDRGTNRVNGAFVKSFISKIKFDKSFHKRILQIFDLADLA